MDRRKQKKAEEEEKEKEEEEEEKQTQTRTYLSRLRLSLALQHWWQCSVAKTDAQIVSKKYGVCGASLERNHEIVTRPLLLFLTLS